MPFVAATVIIPEAIHPILSKFAKSRTLPARRGPEELGCEVSHWSLNLLVDAAIKEGIVDSISAKTISRFLKYGGNPPASRPLLAPFLRKSGFPGNFCGQSE